MVWYRKPGFNRFGGGRLVKEAFSITTMPIAAPFNPPNEEEDWFLASYTLTPIYETGSSTDDVFVGAVFIDSDVDLILRAYLGSTKSGTAVTVKMATSYADPGSSATAALSVSTSGGLASVGPSAAYTVSAGTYLFFYISCASAECSWQCPAIVLVRQ